MAASIFFILFFGFVWWQVEPSLRYYFAAPVFRMDYGFFVDFCEYPGGLLAYGSAFLEQLNYHNWLGALICTAAGALLFLGTRLLGRRTTGVSTRLAPFVPPFLLLLMLDFYDSPVWLVGLGALLALGAGLVYMGINRAALRVGVCWGLGIILFFVAGVWTFLLFISMAVLFEWFAGRKIGLIGNCVASLAIPPLWLVFFAHRNQPDLWILPGQGVPRIYAVALYTFFPLFILALKWWSKLVQPAAVPRLARPGSAPVKYSWRTRLARGRGTFVYGVIFVGACAAVWFTFDLNRKRLIEIDSAADREDWNSAIAAATKVRELDTSSTINLVRALYHAGRLPEDLFSFPIPTSFDLVPGFESGLPAARAQSKTLLELGQVNMAEHFAHEALEDDGMRPEVLELLAQIYLVKGRPKASRPFLNVLSQIPFQGKRAEAGLRRIEGDRTADPYIVEIQSRMVKTDQPGGNTAISTEQRLIHLLQTNPRNQMAFEYLMTQYLLNVQLDKFVAGLEHLDDFGYKAIPRHFEEALLIYQKQNPTRVINLHGRSIRQESKARFEHLIERLLQIDIRTAEGHRALAAEFRNTYWYYLLWAHPVESTPPAGGML